MMRCFASMWTESGRLIVISLHILSYWKLLVYLLWTLSVETCVMTLLSRVITVLRPGVCVCGCWCLLVLLIPWFV